MAECVFHSLWMLNINYKACLHSNVHNAICMAKIFGSSVDGRVGLMILSHARSKKHKLQSFCQFWHACTYRDYRELDRKGQVTDLFYQSESVPGFYPHSSTAEANMLIRTFNVHVKRFIYAHSKSPWILKFSPWNVLEFCSDKTLRTLTLCKILKASRGLPRGCPGLTEAVKSCLK